MTVSHAPSNAATWVKGSKPVSPLAHATLALGLAGLGRIALSSVISIGFGSALFAQYASIVSGIMLLGGLASAGPQASITLGVARRHAAQPTTISRPYLRLIVLLSLGSFVLLLPLGFELFEVPLLVWLIPTFIYTSYQLLRAFSYSVQRSDAVTWAEAVGAGMVLLVMLLVRWTGRVHSVGPLVAIYSLAPLIFSVAIGGVLLGRFRLVEDELSVADRNRSLRESLVFFVGAGSSTVMQFLPSVIAGRLDSAALPAILFGAMHASAPLLMLSRVYATVVMPALAASPHAAVDRHMGLASILFLPCLAIAFGGAPWIVWSLHIDIDLFTVSTAAVVALMMVFQVWSTPAVTWLSAMGREIVPAASSVLGLVLAACIWGMGFWRKDPAYLPIGLGVGSVARSLLPAWIAGGCRRGRWDTSTILQLFMALAMCGIALGSVAYGRVLALVVGAGMGLAGVFGIWHIWRRSRVGL